MTKQAADPMEDLFGAERQQVSDFWKPSTTERLIGKLDRIEEGKKFGDRAIFLNAVLFRLPDHKPIRAGKVTLGIASTLEGKIGPEDSGKYFVIDFNGYGESTGSNNAPRLFTVREIASDREANCRAMLKKQAAILAGNDGDDDDLPF